MSAGSFVQSAISVATPLSLAGLGLALLYLLYSQVLRKKLAPLLEENTFKLLNQVLRYVFYLAMTALVLGMTTYAAVTLCKDTNFCRTGASDTIRLESEIQQHLVQGYYLDALKAAERLTELDPGNAKAHRLKGNAHYRLKNYQAALVSFDRALQIQPEMTEALFNKGAALLKLGDYPRAEEIFTKILNQDAADMPCRFNLAETQLLLGKYDAAQSNYAIVRKESPKHRAGSALGLGIISALAQNDPKAMPAALRYFGEAICVDPKLRAVFLGIPVEENTQRFDTYIAFVSDLKRRSIPSLQAFVLDLQHGKLACLSNT